MILLDYVYYRIHGFFKAMGDDIPQWSSIFLLAVMQCFTVLDAFVFIGYTPSSKWLLLPLFVILVALNRSRYHHDFNLEKFGASLHYESSLKRRLKGFAIWTYLVISFLIPIVYGYLKHNVKAI